MSLQILSIWPTLLITVGLLALASLLARSSTLHRELASTDDQRVSTLDGLRGFLALTVVFSHAVSAYFHRLNGQWEWPAERFYTIPSQGAVVLFFMITGFLFWDRANRGGLSSFGKVLKHYRGRVLRIMPLYLLLVVAVVAILAVDSNFKLAGSVKQAAIEGVKMLFPGLVTYTSRINGIDVTYLMTVTWTLKFELVFYLGLPLIAYFAHPKRFWLFIAGVAAIYGAGQFYPKIYKFTGTPHSYWTIFLFGMLVAQLAPLLKNVTPPKWVLSLVAIAATVGAYFSVGDSAYHLAGYCMLFVAMLAFVLGADLFGLLVTTPARVLGTMTYSIYLLHLPVLWLTFNIAEKLRPAEAWNPPLFWLVTAGSALVLFAVTTLTYRFIEHPFILMGRGKPKPRELAPTELFLDPLPTSGPTPPVSLPPLRPEPIKGLPVFPARSTANAER